MTLWNDKPNIEKWIKEACEANQVPDLVQKIRWQFNRRFASRMGDANCKTMLLRFSAILWNNATSEQKENTVKHETCHLITFHKFGKVEPHGDRWKSVMLECGQKPDRCHKVQTAKKTIEVKCVACSKIHLMGLIRSRKMKIGAAVYVCRDCGGKLVFV